MANEEHLLILKQGVEVWNRWREQNPTVAPDLSGAELIDVDLRRANLTRANLCDANLDEADLDGANLTGAQLKRANLNEANLYRANLTEANLAEANLVGANLNRANFSDADLSHADLRETEVIATQFIRAEFDGCKLDRASAWRTSFTDIDLSNTKGLVAIKHWGPSHIGIDTIFRSKGNIPQAFLRGAGVPDEFITYVASLVGKPIELYSCFVSYSSKDQTFAERLHADLQSNGVRCWFALEDLAIGDKLRPTIDESIRVYDKLLLILSEHSVASNWVEHEVETALAREQEQKHVMLFPIRLDDAVMEIKTGWPAHIKNTRNIGDFRHWKTDEAYQKSFARLLRDLKASEARKA